MKVMCMDCEWTGDEDQLKHMQDKNCEWMDACPNCKTDEYLKDLTYPAIPEH